MQLGNSAMPTKKLKEEIWGEIHGEDIRHG
jgi:hypothetical protein